MEGRRGAAVHTRLNDLRRPKFNIFLLSLKCWISLDSPFPSCSMNVIACMCFFFVPKISIKSLYFSSQFAWGFSTFSLPCQTCPFRWSHLARMKHHHLSLQTGVAMAARESVSQAATPAIRAIGAALSAQMFPLAPLKVADITGALDDISRGFYYVNIRFRPKMANIRI